MKVLRTQLNSKNCIVCGMENPFGLKAPFYVLDNDSVATIVTFKETHQSYPDRTHGGMSATLLDELMGRTLWINEPDTFGVTTTMSVMEDVVKKATEAGIRDKVKIMIGGAPVSEEFCKKIGADCYNVDAASAADSAVEFCK